MMTTDDIRIQAEKPTTFLPLGVGSALMAAVLFGGSTPFAKLLLGDIAPVLLASLFYLGSGIGLSIVYLLRRKTATTEARLTKRDIPWISGALLFGGVIGPALMMIGLKATPASSASLLLNMESVFTAILAWFIFRENFDRRIALGMAAILLGGAILSTQGMKELSFPLGSIAIIGACLAWGIDNNFTQKVSASDPIQIASLKGIVAGTVNLVIALMIGTPVPTAGIIASALIVGLIGYGMSIAFFVHALRKIGTARTSAYFSLAPFIGTLISIIVLGESLSGSLLLAGICMGIGVWLHLTEHHQHEHSHESLVHEHQHDHDLHHLHEHEESHDSKALHTHEHAHVPMTHSHHHYPDIHHRHPH